MRRVTRRSREEEYIEETDGPPPVVVEMLPAPRPKRRPAPKPEPPSGGFPLLVLLPVIGLVILLGVAHLESGRGRFVLIAEGIIFQERREDTDWKDLQETAKFLNERDLKAKTILSDRDEVLIIVSAIEFPTDEEKLHWLINLPIIIDCRDP